MTLPKGYLLFTSRFVAKQNSLFTPIANYFSGKILCSKRLRILCFFLNARTSAQEIPTDFRSENLQSLRLREYMLFDFFKPASGASV